MTNHSSADLVHLVAKVDRSKRIGQILYVNPSQVRSGLADAEPAGTDRFALVLRNSAGDEIGRISSPVRYGMCTNGSVSDTGLIQQDIELPAGLDSIELVQDGVVLDSFRQAAPGPEDDAVAAGAGPELTAKAAGRGFNIAMSGQTPTDDATYTIQAKREGDDHWQTLSVGKKSPDFELDKNQFPGADRVKVRVIAARGFKRVSDTERVVELK